MSSALLTIAAANAVICAGLFSWIRSRFRLGLTSVAEKSEGALYYYRKSLWLFLRGTFTQDSIFVAVHYLSLHLLVPLIGFGFLLRTDVNFLVMLGSIFYSYELIQRLFPGETRGSRES